MQKTRKFLMVSMGGVAALMIIGMVVAALTDTAAEEVKSLDLIAELTWYRVAFFVAIAIILSNSSSSSALGLLRASIVAT